MVKTRYIMVKTRYIMTTIRYIMAKTRYIMAKIRYIMAKIRYIMERTRYIMQKTRYIITIKVQLNVLVLYKEEHHHYLIECIFRLYGSAGSMIPCIHVLFQPIFVTIVF
jgi:hypothetical protein